MQTQVRTVEGARREPPPSIHEALYTMEEDLNAVRDLIHAAIAASSSGAQNGLSKEESQGVNRVCSIASECAEQLYATWHRLFTATAKPAEPENA